MKGMEKELGINEDRREDKTGTDKRKNKREKTPVTF
jgi:hypothetical protein